MRSVLPTSRTTAAARRLLTVALLVCLTRAAPGQPRTDPPPAEKNAVFDPGFQYGLHTGWSFLKKDAEARIKLVNFAVLDQEKRGAEITWRAKDAARWPLLCAKRPIRVRQGRAYRMRNRV